MDRSYNFALLNPLPFEEGIEHTAEIEAAAQAAADALHALAVLVRPQSVANGDSEVVVQYISTETVTEYSVS